MIVLKDVLGFIKKPDDFVLQNPKKTILYSTAFKIITIATFLIASYYPIAFAISSICFFSASIYIDHKILKNIEPLIFQFIEKWVKLNPEKTGVFIGRILEMISEADPASRLRGIYRGFFIQKELSKNSVA